MSSHHWILLGFGNVIPSPQWRMKFHQHDFHELIVIMSGILRVKGPDETLWTGQTGDVFIYPAGCRHEEESDQSDPVETIYFGFNGRTGAQLKSVNDRDGRIRALSRWIVDSRQDTYPRSAQINQAFFEAIGEEFIRLEKLPAKKDVFDTIRGLVFKNIDRKITLDELAASVSTSKFHFIRQYRRKTGLSPMADVRRIRMEEARRLIDSTNLPLKAVAPMVGMTDEYQFSAAFKKYSGHAPGYFRKK
jgi:AraC-like DNA-binding protein